MQDPFETGEAKDKPKPGEVASEPPYADAELGKRHEVAEFVYEPMGAKARGVRIHNGPLKLRDSKAPRDCISWVYDDKQYSPYSYFENPNNAAAPEPKRKARVPPKIWQPLTTEELKRQKGKSAASDAGAAAAAEKEAADKLLNRPPWDTEHNIMVSRMNHEVQVGVREYFGKPIRKESEGIPRMREEYRMNDRQCGWNDDPRPLGENRSTYANFMGQYNVGGPRDQQLPSYWRKVKDWRSFSDPGLKIVGQVEVKPKRGLLEALADTPAAQATAFWRDWSHLSKKRLPDKEPEEKKKGRKSIFSSPTVLTVQTRGGWPAPSSPASSPKKGGDKAAQPAPDAKAGMAATAPSSKKKAAKPEWNDRWWVTMSKDNPHLAQGHRQYFTSAQFLSGAEMGHPGAYLGMPSQKWRDVAKNVTRSPSGAKSRGRIGRTCLLT